MHTVPQRNGPDIQSKTSCLLQITCLFSKGYFCTANAKEDSVQYLQEGLVLPQFLPVVKGFLVYNVYEDSMQYLQEGPVVPQFLLSCHRFFGL